MENTSQIFLLLSRSSIKIAIPISKTGLEIQSGSKFQAWAGGTSSLFRIGHVS
ncbi:MAG: hypothetical protein WBI14_05080 [Anaerolineaceae bacterium]